MAIITSSPDKASAQTRGNVGTSTATKPVENEDESVVLLAARPGVKRLRRAGDDDEPQRRRKEKRVQPNVGVFLDTVAVNSDNEDTASGTDEEIAPETYASPPTTACC